MGYRHYFYLVDKSKCEAIRNMTMSEHAGDELLPPFFLMCWLVN